MRSNNNFDTIIWEVLYIDIDQSIGHIGSNFYAPFL
jgi:hypothetical protein